MGIKTEEVSNIEKKLLEDVYSSSRGLLIIVRKGLVYDGASIPKICWSIVGSPFTGKYTRAALVHDALYMSEALKREECDEIFLDIMKQDSVGYFKRYTMYWAVRGFGWSVWNSHVREEVAKNKQYIRIRND